MRHNEYTEIADNFCKKHNVTVKFAYTGLAANPNWGELTLRPRYRYDIKTPLGHMWGIYWDSIENKKKLQSKDPEKMSEAENRNLAQKPEFSLSSYISGDFASNFEEYYNDQFPGRNTLVKISNKIKDETIERQGQRISLYSGKEVCSKKE